MKNISRRSFLHLGVRISALMGLGSTAAPAMAEALASMARGCAPVLWLQGQSCSGCSVSLLNSDPLGPATLLTQYISLAYHQNLSAATGHTAMDAVNQIIAQGDYILVVEGSVPAAMPKACSIGEELFTKQLIRAAAKAKAVIAAGTCACFGGIPAAQGNPTGAMSIPQYLSDQSISAPLIRIPGCPAHPDWMVGTIAHILKYGVPPLDGLQRPKVFFAHKVHDQCPRFADYEREHFASTFNGEGCLFKLGCTGPLTDADCPLRFWNSGASFCVKAGGPCIGCASPHFAARTDFPLFTKTAARLEVKS